jgi:hypothetical protein
MRLDPYLGDVTGLSSLMVDESRKIAGLLLEDLSENSGQMLLNNKILFRKVLFRLLDAKQDVFGIV